MRHSGSFSRAETAFVIGVPLAWGVLLLFHPGGDTLYDAASSNTTAWLTVHREPAPVAKEQPLVTA